MTSYNVSKHSYKSQNTHFTVTFIIMSSKYLFHNVLHLPPSIYLFYNALHITHYKLKYLHNVYKLLKLLQYIRYQRPLYSAVNYSFNNGLQKIKIYFFMFALLTTSRLDVYNRIRHLVTVILFVIRYLHVLMGRHGPVVKAVDS